MLYNESKGGYVRAFEDFFKALNYLIFLAKFNEDIGILYLKIYSVYR